MVSWGWWRRRRRRGKGEGWERLGRVGGEEDTFMRASMRDWGTDIVWLLRMGSRGLSWSSICLRSRFRASGSALSCIVMEAFCIAS